MMNKTKTFWIVYLQDFDYETFMPRAYIFSHNVKADYKDLRGFICIEEHVVEFEGKPNE